MPHVRSQKLKSKLGPPKAGSVLAVRMLIARTRWLEGHLFWRDGQVVWTTEDADTVPDARELSRTQKCLNKITGFPSAAPAALGDVPAWLTRQRERLELAKRLRELSGSNVVRLASEARRHDPAVAGELSRLLIAESLCLNPLPAKSSEALVILGKPGILPVQALLREGALPQPVRVLAAMILGAISRTESFAQMPAGFLQSGQLSRAYRWCQEHGLPREPALAAALIAGQDSRSDEVEDEIEKAERCLKTVQGDSPFALPTTLLRTLLANGLTPDAVVELAEAAQAAESVAKRLLKVRRELPDLKHRRERQAVSEARRAERQSLIESLAALMIASARATKDPAVLRQMTAFFHQRLDFSDRMTPHFEATAAVLDQALAVTRMGRDLPPELQLSYWELLTERYEGFWNGAALHKSQTRFVSPLLKLLAVTQDKAIVAAALDRGIAQDLAEQEWSDPGLYRLFVTLAEGFDLQKRNYFLHELSRVLDTFTDAKEARAYFQALQAPLQPFPIHTRLHVLEMIFREIGCTRQALHSQVPKLIPFLASLARFAESEDDEWCTCGSVIEATLALAHSVPEQAGRQVEWLLAFLTSLPGRVEWEYPQHTSFRTGLMLATSLAAGDANRFQQAVQTAAQHRFRQDRDQVKDGLRFVDRFPDLRGPLAHLFPQQPQRITDILVRLGLTTRLGTDVHPLLAALVPQAAHEFSTRTCFPVFLSPDAAWWNLHRQRPDLTETAHAHLHAQWVTGRPQGVPPGVRRALDKPQRMAAELAHIRALLAASPDRSDLAARASKLQALLADEPRMTEEIRADVSDRLPHATAEAQTAAIECQVLACYRTRLEVIAGPLPSGVVLTDDLINATLLSVDITANRKLLLSLIRAHIAGENDWRERQPANRAFLESLAGRGVDTNVWLSEFPRRYLCEGVTGKWVHLCLEQDPQHVLQMGNHFGTCLSFGDVNAFSTVANACELNKRVIYARDHAGHIVGRKLIGINADSELVGFHTYCSLTGKKSSTALRRIFQSYAADFARHCSLRMAETGTVPTLFAESWYDDGIVGWGAERQPRSSGMLSQPLSSSSGRRSYRACCAPTRKAQPESP